MCVCVYICSLFSVECSSSNFLGRWLSTTSRAECVRVFHLRSPAPFSLSGGDDDSPVTVITSGEMLVQPGEGLSLVHPYHLPFPLSPYLFFLCEKYLLSFSRRENNHVRWVIFPFSIPMRCLGALLARWDFIFFFFFFLFPHFFPPPQLLGRSFTLQLHPRTRCCRRWQVHSCLFPAAGIQQWSSRRGVTPANLSKKKVPKPQTFLDLALQLELLNLPLG